MKIVFFATFLTLSLTPVWAQYDKTTSIVVDPIICDVKGTQQKLKSVNDCIAIGGTVVEAPEVPKQA